MATQARRTAILKLGVGPPGEVRALDVQRPYLFDLTIDGRSMGSGTFNSPLGDQTWRDVTSALETAVAASDKELGALRRPLETVRSAGSQLYAALAQLLPALRAFLAESTPRRLVILSGRGELHALPWEALIDERWKHHACSGLSIVHAVESFDPVPDPVGTPLTVRTVIGPGTDRLTEPAINALLEKASQRRDARVVRAPEGTAPSILHVEAHGDPARGTIDRGSDEFLDRQHSAALVLLWSCVSNLIQPWGESLAMKLHLQQNVFVLGFTAHVRQDTAGTVARAFYEQVFDGHPPVDPETAIVNERCRLYNERLRACEWASMSVWLRGALDLDAAVLDGPRLPEGAWEARPSASTQGVVRQLQKFGGAGRILTLTRTVLPHVADLDIAAAFRGVAVHVRQGRHGDDLKACLERLTVRAPSAHPGDRLIALAGALSQYPQSLLLWTGAGQSEIDAFHWLGKIPRSLSVVVTAPGKADVPAGIVEGDAGSETGPSLSPESDPLARIEAWQEAGEYSRVAEKWNEVAAGAAGWDADRRRRLHAAGYWSFIRLRRRSDAESSLRELDDISPVEAALLRGNLASRDQQPEEAAKWYRDAEKAGNDRDKGRALLELAYVASRRADGGGADNLYRDALARLEAVEDPDDRLWRSALGRGLRDYADVLAGDDARLDEAAGYLQRALVIHAIDGRNSQVAVALQTRGKLECRRRRFAEADEAIGAAVALQARFKNYVGWSNAMQELIEVALEASEAQRARVLAEALLDRLDANDSDRGHVTALCARACWQLGDLAAAVKWADIAFERLPPSRRDEQVRIAVIRDVAKSLGR